MNGPSQRPRPRPKAGGHGHRRQAPSGGDATRPRRRRGAQPGNLNALKHGLYARHLPPQALQALHEAHHLQEHDLQEEIALARARLDALLATQGLTGDDVRLGLEIIARLVERQYRIGRKARKDLADNLAAILNSLGDQLLPRP